LRIKGFDPPDQKFKQQIQTEDNLLQEIFTDCPSLETLQLNNSIRTNSFSPKQITVNKSIHTLVINAYSCPPKSRLLTRLSTKLPS
jgi:hypothetical protein